MAALNPLPPWQRRGVQGSMTVLALSGVVWWGVHYSIGAGAGELPHPLEAWMMRLHGAALMASLFFLGIVSAQHVPRGWRLARQRGTGLVMLGGMTLLAATGYALYYFATERWRPSLGNVHAAVGLLLSAVLAWHGRPRSR